jgi:hypothetical protein
MEKVGKEGVIMVEEGTSLAERAEVVEGSSTVHLRRISSTTSKPDPELENPFVLL